MKFKIVRKRDNLKVEDAGENFRLEVYSDYRIYMCKVHFDGNKICITPNQHMIAVIETESDSPTKVISFQPRPAEMRE